KESQRDMVLLTPPQNFPTNHAPISRLGTTSSPPAFREKAVVTFTNVRPDTAEKAPPPVRGIACTGMIFLGVDHQKHPSICVAERRSRRFRTWGREWGELRSVSLLG